MNKENKKGKGAAGLRRSALVERIRLREEWSALKETPDVPTTLPRQKPSSVLGKKHANSIQNKMHTDAGSETLRGVVALVEVGGGGGSGRALALRAALAALGATVAPRFSPLVTHLVWAEGGCRATRARARALATRLVSPLWVEACAAAARRLPERAFPAAPRPSDLPSPTTLQAMLKRAEAEGLSLSKLFPGDRSSDTSRETSPDTSIEASCRVNTHPRGAAAAPSRDAAAAAPRSRRKLFTPRDHASGSDEHTEEELPTSGRAKSSPGGRRALARAERLARRLARTPGARRPHDTQQHSLVLSGMSVLERQQVSSAVRALGGRIQSHVTRRTTHVLVGACGNHGTEHTTSGTTATKATPHAVLTVNTTANVNSNVGSSVTGATGDTGHNEFTGMLASSGAACGRARTLKALAGAARGCRVLRAQWALDSSRAQQWLHHQPYQLAHLYKLSQKARAERQALGRMRSEYAYDVFRGMRVRLGRDVEQKDACVSLLTLCGAVVIHHDGTFDKNNRVDRHTSTDAGEFDLTVGTAAGQVSAKWVFDSVAATRMRTARRYVTRPPVGGLGDGERWKPQ